MTSDTNLLTRLERSSELDRRQTDQCAAELVTGWIAGAQAVIHRLRRSVSVVAPGVTRSRHTLRSRYPLVVPEGEQ